jgi:hypothetical protein
LAWLFDLIELLGNELPAAPLIFARRGSFGRVGRPPWGTGMRTLRGTVTWTSGRPPDAPSVTQVRQIHVWRREADGVWRIAMEAFLPLEAGK